MATQYSRTRPISQFCCADDPHIDPNLTHYASNKEVPMLRRMSPDLVDRNFDAMEDALGITGKNSGNILQSDRSRSGPSESHTTAVQLPSRGNVAPTAKSPRFRMKVRKSPWLRNVMEFQAWPGERMLCPTTINDETRYPESTFAPAAPIPTSEDYAYDADALPIGDPIPLVSIFRPPGWSNTDVSQVRCDVDPDKHAESSDTGTTCQHSGTADTTQSAFNETGRTILAQRWQKSERSSSEAPKPDIVVNAFAPRLPSLDEPDSTLQLPKRFLVVTNSDSAETCGQTEGIVATCEVQRVRFGEVDIFERELATHDGLVESRSSLELYEESVHLRDMRISQHLRSFSAQSVLSSNVASTKAGTPHTFSFVESEDSQILEIDASALPQIVLPAMPSISSKNLDGPAPAVLSGVATKTLGSRETSGSFYGSSSTSNSPWQDEESSNSIHAVTHVDTPPASCESPSMVDFQTSTTTNTEGISSKPSGNFLAVDTMKKLDPRRYLSLKRARSTNRLFQKLFKSDSHSVAGYDGPAEEEQVNTSAHDTKPSFSTNYEDTAFVWERAVKGHLVRRESEAMVKRGDTFKRRKSVIPGRKQSTVIVTDVKTSEEFQRRKSSIMNATVFRPIDTDMSFDRVIFPGQEQLLASKSTPDLQSATRSAKVEESTQEPIQEQRSQSLPPGERKSTARRSLSVRIRVPEDEHQGSSSSVSADIETAQAKEKRKVSMAFLPGSSLAAWSRYPSHTRTSRSESAGALDDVLTRDFAPSICSVTDDEELGPLDEDKSRKSKAERWRRITRRKKFFTDIPKIFKPRMEGFRKGERGHRTSVAVGKSLEYPELELLPNHESRLIPDANNTTPSVPLSIARRSSSAPNLDRPHTASNRQPKAPIRQKSTEDISGSGTSAAPALDIPWLVDRQFRASGWAESYRDLIMHPDRRTQRRDTEHLSPLQIQEMWEIERVADERG